VPADDWNLLFDAVTSRLRRSVLGTSEAPAAVGDTVLDCLQALEQLHTALAQERVCSERIERELLQARAALAMAHIELVGTQAGERRARHLAQHDGLTALPNRSYFNARLDDALRPGDHAAPGLAVLYIDLDGFKPINDRHGHATGDEMLRIVAQRLSHSIRAGDTVCRIGGDEFACLLSRPMGREQLSQLAAKLFDAVSAPLKVGALELQVRPSIGIAVCPTDGETATALLTRADTAMYRAKRRQMGYAFFDRHADA
jgi:diguanylate cyclase (GGDEF)-like protein